MKKGAVPVLDHKWWSKNKAKTMKKSGLGKAIQSYEIARERSLGRDMSPDDIAKAGDAALKLLSEVKKKVAFAVTCCNEKTHAETIAALKKYPKVIQGEEVSLKQMVAKSKNAPATAPKQKVGRNLTYWEIDVSKEVKKQINPDWLESFKDYKLHLTLNSDISQVLTDENDPATLAFMVEDAQKVGATVVNSIAATAKKIDAATKGKTGDAVTKARSGFKPLVDNAMKSAAKELEIIPKRRWATFVKRKQQYKEYKIETGKTFTVGILGIGAGIAGLAASPFTLGASTVVGLVSLTRSVLALSREIYNAARSAEQVQTRLENDLKGLKKAYHDADGKARKSMQTGAEITGSVIKGILGTDTVWATLPKCADNAKLLDNKLAGIEVLSRKTAGEIMKGLKVCDALEKTFKGSKDKNAAKVLDKLKKARAALDKTLGQCSDYGGRIGKINEKLPTLQKMLKALQGTNPKFADIFDKVFPTVVNLGLAGAGGGLGLKEAGSTLETANAALGLCNDVVSEIDSHLG